MSTVRAALYARVSTSDQSTALQLDELRQLAAQRGWLVTEYCDTGSGRQGASLPERDRLMADARAGRLQVVLVWRFDRFARSTRDLVDALESLRTWGVEFISLREGIDTSTPTGKLVFTIIAALAEFERCLIVERVKAGLEAARRRGVRAGRPRAVVPVARARELIANGMSLRACAQRLGVDPHTLRRSLRRNPLPETTPEGRMDVGCDDTTNKGGTK